MALDCCLFVHVRRAFVVLLPHIFTSDCDSPGRHLKRCETTGTGGVDGRTVDGEACKKPDDV